MTRPTALRSTPPKSRTRAPEWPRLATAAACALLLAGACADAASDSPAAGPRPNVLIYVADTLRADALGCYAGEAGTKE